MKLLKVLGIILAFSATMHQQAGAMMGNPGGNENNNNDNDKKKYIIGDEEKVQRQQKLEEKSKEFENQLQLYRADIMKPGNPGYLLFRGVCFELVNLYKSEIGSLLSDDEAHVRKEEKRINELIRVLQSGTILSNVLSEKDDGSLRALPGYDGLQFFHDLIEHATKGAPDIQASIFANRAENVELFRLAFSEGRKEIDAITKKLKEAQDKIASLEKAANKNNNNNNNIRLRIGRRDDDDDADEQKKKPQPQDKEGIEARSGAWIIENKISTYKAYAVNYRKENDNAEEKISAFLKRFDKLYITAVTYFELVRSEYPEIQPEKAEEISMKKKNLYGEPGMIAWRLREHNEALDVLNKSNDANKKEQIAQKERLIREMVQADAFVKLPEALRKASLMRDLHAYFQNIFTALDLEHPQPLAEAGPILKKQWTITKLKNFIQQEVAADWEQLRLECLVMEENVKRLEQTEKLLQTTNKLVKQFEDELKEFQKKNNNKK